MVSRRKLMTIFGLMLIPMLIFITTGCAEEEEGVLKIGVSAPLSGPAAAVGIGMPRGAEMAAEEINDAGGVTIDGTNYEIKIVAENDEFTSEGGVSVATSFISDGIKFVIGPISSAACLGAAPTYETNEVLVQHMASAFSATGLDKPFHFRCFPGGVGFLGGFYTWLAETEYWPGIETVVMLNPADASGYEVEPSVRAAAIDNGFEVLASEFVPRGITVGEAAALVLGLLAHYAPDLIDMGVVTTGEAALILTELHDQGYEGKIVALSAQPPLAMVAIAGVEATEGIMVLAGDPESPVTPDAYVDFYNSYVERYGEVPFMIGTVDAYNAVYSYAMAIEEAGTLDTTAVRDALEDLEWECVHGPAYWGGEDLFGIKRQLIRPILFSVIHDGALVHAGLMDAIFYAPAE